MDNKKRRTRTGCRTCRARRVKCDERKPTCNRCEVANVQCAGYYEKRLVNSTPLVEARPDSESPRIQLAPSRAFSQDDSIAHPRFREDGLPLIGLPNNPNLSQRPHSRARDILAYHQFLFRTLPVLFFSEHLYFWKAHVCEAAWDTEYVYDALVALGGMHRAILMISQPGENDKDRGIDTKVIAVQSYVRALQELAVTFEEAKNSLTLLVSALSLFAYFECFSGNIPATIRHVRMAHHYFALLSSGGKVPGFEIMLPLESALRQLSLITLIVLPLPTELDFSGNLDNRLPNLPMEITHESPPLFTEHVLQDLYDIMTADEEVLALIWMPAAPFLSAKLNENALNIFHKLKEWESRNHANLTKHQLEDYLSEPVNPSWETVEGLTFPPVPLTDVPPEICFAFILYTFCKMRLLWAICILDPSKESYELDAYFYLYQHLRFVSASFGYSLNSTTRFPVTCESLNIGVAPMLYLAGHCCPKFAWLQYVISMLQKTGSQGIFDAQIHIKSLENLRLFEEHASKGVLSLNLNSQLPDPSSRVFSVLLPVPSGGGYVAYYVTRRNIRLARYRGKEYSHLGTIDWLDSTVDREANAASRGFPSPGQLFNTDWLLEQRAVKEWIYWGGKSEFHFNLDWILSDHINGSAGLSNFESKRGDGTDDHSSKSL